MESSYTVIKRIKCWYMLPHAWCYQHYVDESKPQKNKYDSYLYEIQNNREVIMLSITKISPLLWLLLPHMWIFLNTRKFRIFCLFLWYSESYQWWFFSMAPCLSELLLSSFCLRFGINQTTMVISPSTISLFWSSVLPSQPSGQHLATSLFIWFLNRYNITYIRSKLYKKIHKCHYLLYSCYHSLPLPVDNQLLASCLCFW